MSIELAPGNCAKGEKTSTLGAMERVMTRNVGDGFYTFERELLGNGYMLQKRWVTEVNGSSYRYAGGAVESPHDGPDLPWCGGETKQKAFQEGKKQQLAAIRRQETHLREKFTREMQALQKDRRRLLKLTLENCPVRGDKETYERFKQNWDSDF